MTNHPMTMAEIRAAHPGCYVEEFDSGLQEINGTEVPALDVLVWQTKDDAENDAGANAIARYLIPR